MENSTGFIFQMMDIIFVTLSVVIDFIKEFLPSIDIVSGIILFALSMCVVCLMMRIEIGRASCRERVCRAV